MFVILKTGCESLFECFESNWYFIYKAHSLYRKHTPRQLLSFFVPTHRVQVFGIIHIIPRVNVAFVFNSCCASCFRSVCRRFAGKNK